ncbi:MULTISPECIES: hypothetical protein [Streptomyces]|uniref:hypothetical protein n=1 Tax=Streptomyces TaxID=1883 RepID=UPI000BEF2531|nr:hypothetical protein [Streptomyces sp. ms184]
MTGEALGTSERAAARLAAATAGLPPLRAGQESLNEEICDRLIDLAAAHAAVARTADDGGRDAAARSVDACVCRAVEDDVVRTLSRTGTRLDGGPSLEDAHREVTRIVTRLAEPAHYDAVCALLRTGLGDRPDGRAAGAWDIADEALRGLVSARAEWAGADPACTAAGGWVVVDRVARVRLTAALLAQARALGGDDAEHLVNAARRYAWNWLRLPPPEAATAVHVRRTGELAAWIGVLAAGGPATEGGAG